jgi:Glycosyl transferases group 1
MSNFHTHIIAFDIPYPPTYGGVIDVFYKIKVLSEAGIKVHLHAFEYGKGQRSKELEKLCYSVNYYSRKTGLISSIGLKPYITVSRRSTLLMKELVKDNYPILFEGLHTCFYINDIRLAERLKLVRTTNIEHRYYANLALAERNMFKKIYFSIASLKLWYYQKVIRFADIVFPVSESDATYFQKIFPSTKIHTLPCFHANNQITIEKGDGKFVLFHGNLEVAENEKAAVYLIKKVMNDIDYPLIIAGNSPSKRLLRISLNYPNVTIKASPDEKTMADLINKAHINLLITFQATGLKLKLLNALYNGSFVVANNKILHGTGLDELCFIANTAPEMKKKIQFLIKSKYYSTEGKRNITVLTERYDNTKNAINLITLIKGEGPEQAD